MLRVIFYVTGVFMSSQYAGVSLQAETTQRNVEAGSPGTFWVQKWLDSQTLKNKKRGWVSAFPKNIPSNVRIVWWNCDKRLHPPRMKLVWENKRQQPRSSFPLIE